MYIFSINLCIYTFYKFMYLYLYVLINVNYLPIPQLNQWDSLKAQMTRLHHQYSLWHLTSYLTIPSLGIVHWTSLDYDTGHIELLCCMLTLENSNHQGLPELQWIPPKSHYLACWPWIIPFIRVFHNHGGYLPNL